MSPSFRSRETDGGVDFAGGRRRSDRARCAQNEIPDGSVDGVGQPRGEPFGDRATHDLHCAGEAFVNHCEAAEAEARGIDGRLCVVEVKPSKELDGFYLV